MPSALSVLHNYRLRLSTRYRNLPSGVRGNAANALFVLFLVGILAYGAAFAWYMLANFDLVNLLRDVNNDDSFYYFQIAYNLAAGQFSTFDGGITRTNGYHPLWLLLITPFYWVFDKEAALFGIKAFEIMLVAGGVALVAAAARLARLPWLLLFAALPVLYQQRGLFAGLEAAAALFMLGLFLLALTLYARNPDRWRWVLVAAAFALPWARLEYAAIALAAAAALCAMEWPRQERPAGVSWRAAMPAAFPSFRTLAPVIGAGAGILIYFIYNGLTFGGIVPVSGVTKQAWSEFRWEYEEEGYSIVGNFRAVLQSEFFDFELLVALEVCAYLLLVWWCARRSGDWNDRLLLVFLVGVFGLAVGHLAKFAQIVATTHPVFGIYNWYFVPAYLMMALAVPVRCYVAIYCIRRFIGPRYPRAARLLSVGICVAGAVVLLTKADFSAPFADVDRRSASYDWDTEVGSYLGVQVINHLLPDNSIVGSWDAGVIGYFARFPVVNLDGLVNSYDYYQESQQSQLNPFRKGVFKPAYRDLGVTHLANTTRQSFARPLFEDAVIPSDNSGSRFQFSADSEPPEDFDPAVWLWERMEPHFDYHADGVGLVVDGRMARGMPRNCAEGLTVWLWASGEDAVVADAVTNRRPGQRGICAATVILPREATTPARVTARPVRDLTPEIRSHWDVYFVANRLIYIKEQCRADDTDAMFFLHLKPLDVADLPEQSRPYGFYNPDFAFAWNGVLRDGKCWVMVNLPEYPIVEIRTGQYVPAGGGGNWLWEGEIRAGYAPLVGDRQPEISSNYDVHLIANRLLYIKEQCRPADTDAAFFLHLVPVDPADLPDNRRQYGFDNRDFSFRQDGQEGDGKCWTQAVLPEYDIAEIRTGQYRPDAGNIWQGAIRPD